MIMASMEGCRTDVSGVFLIMDLMEFLQKKLDDYPIIIEWNLAPVSLGYARISLQNISLLMNRVVGDVERD